MHFLWGVWRPGLFAILWGLLLIIPGIIAMIKYSMTVYILLDKPELSVKEAMKLSSEITMGHKLKIFGAVFVIMMIFVVCNVLLEITTQSLYITQIVTWGITIILAPFGQLFFAGIYERIRRS